MIVFVTAYPVYYMIIASLSNITALTKNYGMLWLPLEPFSITAYELVFPNPLVLSGYANTLFILIISLILNLELTVIGVYCLALKNSMLMKPLAILILFTMYFSGGMVPIYINIRNLGLIDSLWALILPNAINTYNLLIMRSAFASIPDSLFEASYLDGASHLKILFSVYVPLSGATLAVMVLHYAVGHWNS